MRPEKVRLALSLCFAAFAALCGVFAVLPASAHVQALQKVKQQTWQLAMKANSAGGQQGDRSLPGPVITSVSPIRPLGAQTITIRGSGFGKHDPFNGCSNFLTVEDVTDSWTVGLCVMGQGTIYVKSWTDGEIVIGGFPLYGRPPARPLPYSRREIFEAGDVVLIKVANAQGDGIIPPTAPFNWEGGPVASYSVTVTTGGNPTSKSP